MCVVGFLIAENEIIWLVLFTFISLFGFPTLLSDSLLEVIASKLVDFCGLNIVRNIWENVSRQLDKFLIPEFVQFEC